MEVDKTIVFRYKDIRSNCGVRVSAMVLNSTQSVLLVEETGVPGGNHRPAALH